ncbi:MAG: winged helix-turn-helix domain-containing protein [Proteobacteria bacterium]|nr:winged helix-turn-helix domain-containing protein [Pseudomonadota bacterium]
MKKTENENVLEKANQLIREDGKLSEAAKILKEFVKEKPKGSDAIEAYALLIRISAETREFEKISEYVDEVKKIPITKDSEKRPFANCLYHTGTVWHFSGNASKARQYFLMGLDVANELGDKALVFKCKLGLADILRSEGFYNDVFEQEADLLKAAQESGDPLNIGSLKILIGNVFRKQGLTEKAIPLFEEAKVLFNNNKNSSGYHYVLWAIGTCYAALEDHERATIYLDLATNNSAGGVEFWRINILSRLTLAELCTTSGNYAQAEAHYSDIAASINGDESSYYGRRMLRGQALLAIREGKFELANEKIDQLVVMAVKENNHRQIMRLRPLKAEVLLRTGEAAQHEQATEMLEEAYIFYKEKGMRRHLAVCLELLARLDSRCGYPAEALKKADEMLKVCNGSDFERHFIKAKLIEFVLNRKVGRSFSAKEGADLLPLINRLNAEVERVILSRFLINSYDSWTAELAKLNPFSQRCVNEFFEDFHFVPEQSIDMEIDPISHYVREKHLGEIPFHNKFTLMKILMLLAEKPGKEYSKEELAMKIWQQEYNPLRHDNNIYININRLRKLVEPNPRESRYIMNGSQGYYFNPNMKVNISTKIAETAPRLASQNKIQPEIR